MPTARLCTMLTTSICPLLPYELACEHPWTLTRLQTFTIWTLKRHQTHAIHKLYNIDRCVCWKCTFACKSVSKSSYKLPNNVLTPTRSLHKQEQTHQLISARANIPTTVLHNKHARDWYKIIKLINQATDAWLLNPTGQASVPEDHPATKVPSLTSIAG